MLAKAHVNLGFIASLALKIPFLTGPGVIIVLAMNLAPNVLRLAVLALAAAVSYLWSANTALLTPLVILTGSLAADFDQPNSMLSRMIAPTPIVVRLMLLVAGTFIAYLTWGKMMMFAGLLLIVSGALKLNIIPMEIIQRLILIVSGIILIIWSYNQLVLALGVLYLLMGVLSHRGLTHSPEGWLLFVFGAWWFTQNIGHPELLMPFAMTYLIHLAADMFSDHGVYASYIAGVKLSIPLVTTDGFSGKIVVFASFVAVMALFLGRGDEIRRIYSFITQLIK